MNQTFVYLGGSVFPQGGRLHSFYHTQTDHTIPNDALDYACSELYPTMINETMIQEGDNLLVFSMRSTGRMRCVQVAHHQFPRCVIQLHQFPVYLLALLTSPREGSVMVIKVEFKRKQPSACKLYVLTDEITTARIRDAVLALSRDSVTNIVYEPVQFQCNKPLFCT